MTSCGLDIDGQNPMPFYEKKLKTRWQRKWEWGQVKGPQQKKQNQNRDSGLKEKKKEWENVWRQEEQEINQGEKMEASSKGRGEK